MKDILTAFERRREDANDDGAYLRESGYYENLGNDNGSLKEGEVLWLLLECPPGAYLPTSDNPFVRVGFSYKDGIGLTAESPS